MKSKENICIICYHMIPYTRIWGASQRMYYLANFLSKKFGNVYVLHSKFGLFTSLYNDKEFLFQALPISINLRFFQNLQQKMQSSRNGDDAKNIGFSFNPLKLLLSFFFKILKKIYRTLEKFFFNDYNFIGLFVYIWNISARSEIQSLIENKGVNKIIISGPYFVNFFLIFFIKKRYPHVKVILDYRDPWTINKYSLIPRLIECKVLKKADMISFFSDKFKYDMIKLFSIDKKKCLTVLNGYDKPLWEKINTSFIAPKVSQNKKFIVCYASSDINFYDQFRSPASLIDSLKYLKSFEVEIRILGVKKEEIKLFENKYSIYKEKVKFFELTSHSKCIEFMKDSDVNVILVSDLNPSKYIISGKFFDCLASRKLLLGISDNFNIDFISKISRLKIGTYSRNNPKSIANKILVLNQKTSSSHTKLEYNEYSRDNQNSIFFHNLRSF